MSVFKLGLQLTLFVHIASFADAIVAPSPIKTKDISLKSRASHTCVILENDLVKCWGLNTNGQLGVNNTYTRGDYIGEMGDNLRYAEVGAGRTVKQVIVSNHNTCVLLDSGEVKCWGAVTYSYGNTDKVGGNPNDMGDNLPSIDLGTGRTAVQISKGSGTTCALLDNSELKCWGNNDYGQLGQGDTETRGDEPDELGDNLTAIDLGTGRFAVYVFCGDRNVCALLDNGDLKCWGDGTNGQLGQGDSETLGDEPYEMGDNLTAIDLGTGRSAVQIHGGDHYLCALLADGDVKCWGNNNGGILGIGSNIPVGNLPGQMGDALPSILLGTGRTAVNIFGSHHSTCVVLDNGDSKCWGGWNAFATLGTGDTRKRGRYLSDMGDNLDPIELGTGETPVKVVGGSGHACALLSTGYVKCWGLGTAGRLGNGGTAIIGDSPTEMGNALQVVDLGTIITEAPTGAPAGYTPTYSPTDSPSFSPTDTPTKAPVRSPTFSPSLRPTGSPLRSPTDRPSPDPTNAPTSSPSFAPTNNPSSSPSFRPSFSPTDAPTSSPSFAPSVGPTKNPSSSPSFRPSFAPTDTPTTSPSFSPSFSPTTAAPTRTPTTECFKCPPNSKKFFAAKNCASNFNDCKCDDGYKRDLQFQQCIYCNTFKCPINSTPRKNECCIDSFAKCKCDYGFERQWDQCISCKTFECPKHSKPKDRRCIRNFDHCECDAGFIKSMGVCMPNN